MRGAMISVVGPDASGKSTLSAALVERFGKSRVDGVLHLGWPPATPVTKVLRTAVLGIRKALRLLGGESSREGLGRSYPRSEAALRVLTALDRRSLARRARRLADSGEMVFTDRYPGATPGSASGLGVPPSGSGLDRWFHEVEARIYESIPSPDIVVRVNVPVEETVRRNAARTAPKPESMIRASHAASHALRFEHVPEIVVENTRPLEEIVPELLDAVGRELGILASGAPSHPT